MNILPRRISKVSFLKTSPDNKYGFYIESTNHNLLLLGTPKENCNVDTFHDLIEKYAYASALLYFSENFDLVDNKIDINKLNEDINVLLHSRCKVVNEKAPLMTKINNYPIYEGVNYVLRGEGDAKIKESFNLNEDINIEDIDLDFIRKYINDSEAVDSIIKDFVACPKCKNVYEQDALKTSYEDYPDDYNGNINNDPISYTCPYCGYTSRKEETFSDAWIDDLRDAPNIDEYISGAKEFIDSQDLEEDVGTQASDIASKIDYTFQSAPTSLNKKKKYEAVEIKELDESTYINLTGFIKDIDGFYKRGNYVLVKESATDKLKVINKNKLNEEIVQDTLKVSSFIPDYIDKKINQKYPDRYKVNSGRLPGEDIYGVVIEDTLRNRQGDLIEVNEYINSLMDYLKLDKTDYEIDFKGNKLIIAIYNDKQINSTDSQFQK